MFGIQADETRQAYVYTDPAWPEETQRFKSFNGATPKYSWHKHKKDEPCLGLYGLDQALTISSTNNEQHVTLVEGEPDCWTMGQAGLAAVSFTGGAATVPDGAVEVLASSNFTHVDVIYDLDTAGREGSWRAAAALESKGMAVRVLSLPETLGAKADVSTFYAHVGADDARFRAELAALEESPKPSSAPTLEDRDTSDADLTYKDRSEADNAERLVQLHGERLHFLPKWKKWIVFIEDQQTWLKDDADVRVRQLAKDVGRSLKRQFADIPTEDGPKWASFILKSLSNAGITGMVTLARGIEGIPLDHEQLDSDEWMLGVKNGVVDLKTGKLRPADPADLMTMQCPVEFDPDAECPRFEQAMSEWFPDEEVRGYVRRVAGSSLVGFQEDHIFVIHYGDGRNGKGTFVRALQNVLGRYARVIHLSLLVNTKGSQHDTIKADLFRARLAVASETKSRIPLDEASVKNLTGNDRITARRMHEDPWEFRPSHSLWLLTNDLPQISGTDRGIWSRTKVVKWEATFEGKKDDKKLDAKLRAEAPGILNWLLEGCLEWQDHGLKEPEAVVRETLAYREAEDVIARFLKDENLVLDEGEQIPSKKIQALLEGFASREGLKLQTVQRDLSKWLQENGCSKSQVSREWFWKGVGQKGDACEL
jgi:putative DNA primase/helicase